MKLNQIARFLFRMEMSWKKETYSTILEYVSKHEPSNEQFMKWLKVKLEKVTEGTLILDQDLGGK